MEQFSRSRVPAIVLISNIPYANYDFLKVASHLEKTSRLSRHIKHPILHFVLKFDPTLYRSEERLEFAELMMRQLCQFRPRYGIAISTADNQYIAVIKPPVLGELHLFVNSINRHGQICFPVDESSQVYEAIWEISQAALSRDAAFSK